MNITGSYYLTGIFNNQTIATSFSGAFSGTGASSGGSHYLANYSTNGIRQKLSFSAQNNWTGSTSSNGNHTHTVTVTVNKNTSIYGNSTTVQPASLKVRVKTRAK